MSALTHVRPGDVISSEFFNQILDRINDLENRLGEIEDGIVSPTQNLISRFEPAVEIEVGRVLTMFGTFDFPPSANSVTIADIPLQSDAFRPGSNAAQLLFIVPTTISVPQGSSRNITITVRTSHGSDSKSYRLLPAVQSTVPTPAISTIVDLASSSPIIRTGSPARITGTNFATNPSENIVRFKINTPTGIVTYPHDGEPRLVVDSAQSSPTQIVVTVPAIIEIGPAASNATAPVTVEVDTGAAAPAAKEVVARRVA